MCCREAKLYFLTGKRWLEADVLIVQVADGLKQHAEDTLKEAEREYEKAKVG